MSKEYKIKEESLLKLKQYLDTIPHGIAKEIESFLFNSQTLEEIKEGEVVEENGDND